MDNNNIQNSSGMMNGMPPEPKVEKKLGPIVGTLIIILVLIIAALYFFGQKLNVDVPPLDTAQSGEVSEENTATAASSLDDVSSIEADLDDQLSDVDYSF